MKKVLALMLAMSMTLSSVGNAFATTFGNPVADSGVEVTLTFVPDGGTMDVEGSETQKVSLNLLVDSGAVDSGWFDSGFLDYYYGTYTGGTPAASKLGYTLDGWYNGNDKLAAGDFIGADTTFTAQWAEKTYSVTVNSGAATDKVTTATVDLTAPTKEGFTFAGWLINGKAAGWKPAAPATTTVLDILKTLGAEPAGDTITLVAKWTANPTEPLTATFYDGETTLGNGSVDKNGMVTPPAAPDAKCGYTFGGWAVKGTAVAYDFAAPITADTEFVSLWTPNIYAVTIKLENGSSDTTTSYTTDGTVPVSRPTRSGYTFAGWKLAGTDVTYPVNTTAIPMAEILSKFTAEPADSKITLEAVWSKNSSGGGGGGDNDTSTGGTTTGGGTVAPPDATNKSESAAVKPNGEVVSTAPTVTTEKATGAVKEAIEAAKKTAGSTDANIRVANVSTVGSDVIKSLVETAKAENLTPILVADTMNGTSVAARISVDLTKLPDTVKELNLAVAVGNAPVENLFQQYYSNTIQVVSFAQKGEFGTTIQAAVKVDLTKLNVKTLQFYTYDVATNAFMAIPATGYFVDGNGYLHFDTAMGNNILITDKKMTAK